MTAPGLKTFNQSFSCLGGLVVPVDLDFTNANRYEADLTAQVQQGQIDFIQSVYINLRDAAFDIVLTGNVGNHQVVCKAGKMIYSPIMLNDSPKFIAEVSVAIAAPFQILVSNIPFFPMQFDAT